MSLTENEKQKTKNKGKKLRTLFSLMSLDGDFFPEINGSFGRNRRIPLPGALEQRLKALAVKPLPGAARSGRRRAQRQGRAWVVVRGRREMYLAEAVVRLRRHGHECREGRLGLGAELLGRRKPYFDGGNRRDGNFELHGTHGYYVDDKKYGTEKMERGSDKWRKRELEATSTGTEYH